MNHRYAFETFVVGPCNERAHAAAVALAETAPPSIRPLFILGAEGCGKTHLMRAIGHRILERTRVATVAYLSFEKLGIELVHARGDGTIAGLLARYAKVDVLLLDDVQSISYDEAIQEAVLRFLSDFITTGSQLVLTGNGPVAGVVPLIPVFAKCLQNFNYVEIGLPDFETRLAIVRAKAVGLKAVIPAPVLEFVAMQVTKNVRQLEGALIRIASEAAVLGRPASLAYAQHVLREASEDDELMAVHIRPL
jgi:chromosomal replication initiator protein